MTRSEVLASITAGAAGGIVRRALLARARAAGLSPRSATRAADSGHFQQPIATEITEAGAFTSTESYYRGDDRKHPIRSRFDRNRRGRGARLRQRWGESPH